MVCIDSIQATQNCTTETQHSVFPATVGAGPVLPDSAVCTLPQEHAEELDREVLPALLRQRLQLLHLPLSPTAAVSVRDRGRQWQVADESCSYSVRLAGARIAVYPEPR